MTHRTAPEIIAFHFCSDIQEVKDMVYQPTIYASPRIYCWGDDYFSCPAAGRKPSSDPRWKWEKVAEYYGRTIYKSDAQYQQGE
jgi:hypothetical protein